jgi:ABC-type glycerol-3-phosphate transport system substrate-binding protein
MRNPRLLAVLFLMFSLGGLLTSCSSGGASSSTNGKVTLTFWENFGGDQHETVAKALIRAFEQLHPNITIVDVPQPGANYFALLSAAAISGRGPDMSNQFTGLFVLKDEGYLLNLKPYLTMAQINSLNGINYSSVDFNPSDGPLLVPADLDSYIGFYNKSLFAEAGLSGPPQDWNQLFSDCSTLKAHGIQPMIYGQTGALTLGAEFYPYYDFTYLLAGANISPAQMKGLYTGQIPYTSPAIVQQLTKWSELVKDGCTNKDVLTASNTLTSFEQGKAAMIVDGTWDEAALQQAMGSKLAPFVPPYSSTPLHAIVFYPGEGFGVSRYSKHIPQDIEFIKFLFSPQAAQIIAAQGVDPPLKGQSTDTPIFKDITDLVNAHYAVYPMVDNIIQGQVVNTGSTQLDAAFGGQTSPQQALQSMQSALMDLPSNQRNANYSGG